MMAAHHTAITARLIMWTWFHYGLKHVENPIYLESWWVWFHSISWFILQKVRNFAIEHGFFYPTRTYELKLKKTWCYLSNKSDASKSRLAAARKAVAFFSIPVTGRSFGTRFTISLFSRPEDLLRSALNHVVPHSSEVETNLFMQSVLCQGSSFVLVVVEFEKQISNALYHSHTTKRHHAERTEATTSSKSERTAPSVSHSSPISCST